MTELLKSKEVLNNKEIFKLMETEEDIFEKIKRTKSIVKDEGNLQFKEDIQELSEKLKENNSTIAELKVLLEYTKKVKEKHKSKFIFDKLIFFLFKNESEPLEINLEDDINEIEQELKDSVELHQIEDLMQKEEKVIEKLKKDIINNALKDPS